MSASVLTLTPKDRRALSRLLGRLQTRIEQSIQDAEPLAGSDSPGYFAGESELIRSDRKDLRAAERWVQRLEVAG